MQFLSCLSHNLSVFPLSRSVTYYLQSPPGQVHNREQLTVKYCNILPLISKLKNLYFIALHLKSFD